MFLRYVAGGVGVAALLSFRPAAPVLAQKEQHAQHAVLNGPLPEAVRKATERYRDVTKAIADGYAQFGGCVSGPDKGAMGVHFSNFALFDGVVDVEKPEALVYEPRNGRLHLVAVEYIIPAPLWDPAHGPFDKPHLMGHLLQFIGGPNRYGPDAIYELHVWAWKANTSGPFADWNPKVSCIEWAGPPF